MKNNLSIPPARDAILSITWPEDGKIRARKVVTRSRARSTGKYPSWKMDRMVQWESIHERNAFVLLDANPSVSVFSEQPCVIAYMLAGVPHQHFPDVFVDTPAGPELWEIKEATNAADKDVAARTRLMEEELPRLGFRYRVVLAEDLASEPLLSNARMVIKCGRTAQLDEAETETLRRDFVGMPPRIWGEVLEGRFGPRGQARVCRLMLMGLLRMNLRLPLGPDTPLFGTREH